MCVVTLRSNSARRIGWMTSGSASLLVTISTDSPGARMPIPLPCRPDWLRTSARAAGIKSSTDLGGLKYDGQRGSGYLSPAAAPPDAVALAPSERFDRLQSPATAPAAASR